MKNYERRLKERIDELKWLYMELYNNEEQFIKLCNEMRGFFESREATLKKSDMAREKNPDWYKAGNMLGMCLYIDNFGKNIKGVQEKIPYLKECGVNYVHLMPFLDTVKGKSDGGYAVADFRKVEPSLGTIEDLEELSKECHKNKISLCMDFVMNHTSEEHEWAKRARSGDGEYMARYFFYDNDVIPNQYEETVPQVFPETAPGNFTWLPECSHYVMTSFYPYQWDLNYKNPIVFNEMMYNFLFLANKGLDVIRIDAVPYIWKELGTDCRNLPQVHTIVRMMRMIGEIVCPGVILLGEVVMEPEKVAPYFGTVDKPECHMLYNVTTMATIWHTVATRQVYLLRKQLDTVYGLPKEYTFLNYLRCHDDIGWGLDYKTLATYGIEEVAHKKYLNDFFLGKTGFSKSSGELYNYDPVTGDARFCGTCASLCGVESAQLLDTEELRELELKKAIQLDVMLHAFMFMQSGLPILYSGDEIGQINDYSYRSDKDKAVDTRYVHRGSMKWELAEKRKDKNSLEGKIFKSLKQLLKIRKKEKVFDFNADTWTMNTFNDSILGVGRYLDGEKLIGLFNFSENPAKGWLSEKEGIYQDLLTGKAMDINEITLNGYEFMLLKRVCE